MEFKDNGDKQELYEDVVLIESDWNLKGDKEAVLTNPTLVLIESDWNLKRDMELSTIDGAGSINRIRLEFKDECRCFYSSY